MNLSLTPAQAVLLRRCSGGLRVWEVGGALQSLHVQLDILRLLDLVSYDESSGFETTPTGEAWLVEFDE